MDDFCLPPSTQSPLAAVSAIDDADAQETLRAIVFANYDHVFGPIALQIFANFAVNGNADYWRELGTRWSRLMLSCEWNSNDSLLEDYKEEWSVKQKFAKMPDTGKITALICRRSDQVSAILAIDRSVFHHNLSYLLSDITEGSWQSDPCPSSISIQSYVQSLRCQQQLKQPLNWKLLESNFTWKFLSMAITAHLQSRYTLLFAGTHHSIFSELRRLLQLLSSPRQAIFFIQQIPEGSYATDSCLITPVSVYTKNQRSFCKPDQAEERWTEFNRQSIIIKRLTDSLSQVPRSLRELFITRQFQPYLDRLSFVLLRSLQPYLCATAGHSTVPGNHGTPPAAGSSFTSPFTSPHSSPNLPPSTGTSSSTPTLKTHHNNQSMNHLPFTTVRKSLFGGAAATEEDLNNSSTTTPIKILPRIQAIFYNLLLPQPEACKFTQFFVVQDLLNIKCLSV
jgi:hypothetical protein